MSGVLIVLAVIGLGARPSELTGPDPAGYAAKLEESARVMAQLATDQACPTADVRSVTGAPVDSAGLRRDGVSSEGVTAAFREHMRVDGCGRSTAVRLYIARHAQGLGVISLPPGTGVTGYRLSHDAIQGAVAAARIQRPAPACAEAQPRVRLADTSLTSPYAAGHPWTERWTFYICGQARPVEIAFTPAADGGTNWSIKAR